MAGKYLTRTIKTTLIAVFTFQLLSTVERQVFDFLGYMWAPIIGNFFQIIAVILGLFGACQHYRSFVVVYAIWSLLWLGWNIFVICLYLEVGILNRNRERYILTIGTESKSWWLEHGIGCIITNNSWATPQHSADSSRPIPPEEFVQGCILQYYYVEVIHAAVQVLLSLVGLVVSFVIIYNYLEEEDACKYLVNSSTYTRPLGSLSTLPLARARPPGRLSVEEGMGTYRPVATRDSWCIPTYVSYHDSMEWSGSYSSEHPHHHHQQQQPPHQQQQEQYSRDSDASLIGAGLNERGRHSPSPGFESSGSVSSAATTQPYLRLSMTGSDQVQLVGT